MTAIPGRGSTTGLRRADPTRAPGRCRCLAPGADGNPLATRRRRGPQPPGSERGSRFTVRRWSAHGALVVRRWSGTSVGRKRCVHSPCDQRLCRRDAAHWSRRDGDRGAAARRWLGNGALRRKRRCAGRIHRATSTFANAVIRDQSGRRRLGCPWVSADGNPSRRRREPAPRGDGMARFKVRLSVRGSQLVRLWFGSSVVAPTIPCIHRATSAFAGVMLCVGLAETDIARRPLVDGSVVVHCVADDAASV
jgi:hypothetical protein